MAMTPELQKATLEKIVALWKQGRLCPICATGSWQMLPAVVGTPELGAHSPEHGVVPSVVLVCSGCGYSLFFNAFKLGLITPTPDPPAPTPPTKAEPADDLRPRRRRRGAEA